MKRPAGLITSVVVLAFGALAYLVFAAGFALAAATIMDRVNAQPLITVLVVFLLLVLYSGWAAASAIGVWKLRPWGRRSALTLAGYLIFMMAGLALFLAFVPAVSRTPRLTQQLKIVQFVMLCIAVLQVAVASLLIGYFNQTPVKQLFEQPSNRSAELPVSIFVVALQLLHAAFVNLTIAAAHGRAPLIGVELEGWPSTVWYVAVGTVSAFIGLALLKLHPSAWWWALAFLGLNIAYAMVIWVAGPGEPVLDALESGKLEQFWMIRILSVTAAVAGIALLLARRTAYNEAARAAMLPAATPEQ